MQDIWNSRALHVKDILISSWESHQFVRIFLLELAILVYVVTSRLGDFLPQDWSSLTTYLILLINSYNGIIVGTYLV